MIATDKLIAMLKERGVEYVIDHEYGEKYPPEQNVTWSVDLAGEDMTVTARDYCIGMDENGELEYYCLDLEFHEVFTPEQAIAATLGAGTCKKVRVHMPIEDEMRCSKCWRFLGFAGDIAAPPYNYCPNCGAKVVDK